MSAESQHLLLGEVFVRRASTGPRSIERGEANVPAGREGLYFQLQRGRARLSAERADLAKILAETGPASTGPRSIERGEV